MAAGRIGQSETEVRTKHRGWRGGIALLAVAAGLATGTGDASAVRGDYLDILQSHGIYSSAPGAASCFDYPGDGASGCSRRFTTGDDALHTGYWVCDQLGAGRSPSSIAHGLYTADGLFLSKKNSAIVIDAAQKELCE